MTSYKKYMPCTAKILTHPYIVKLPALDNVGEFSVCAAGYGGTSCTACAAGNYKSTTGSAACSPCPVSTYQTQTGNQLNQKRESIPVGCLPPVCKPYVLQWPAPDVTSQGVRGGPQVNKFEQVSSTCHQMSLLGSQT